MTALTIITLGMTLILGALFLGLFCWAVKDGQFDDVEEAKYQIFRDDDESGDEQ